MKKILALVLILTTLAMTFIACTNNTPSENNRGTEATQPITTQPITTQPIATQPIATQPIATQAPTDTSSQENKGIIPKDPQELMNIITQMGFEPRIQSFTKEDTEMANNLGITLDDVDGLTFVGLFIGSSDFLQFGYCSNLKTTLALRASIADDNDGFITKLEGNIVVYGKDYLWDAFVEFVTNHN